MVASSMISRGVLLVTSMNHMASACCPEIPDPPATGQAIKCQASSDMIFRMVQNNVYRWYPNPTIAASWDPAYSSFIVVDCLWLTRGPDMPLNTLVDGQSIKCSESTAEIYRYVGAGKYRWYPNPAIASSWDPNWASFTLTDCSPLVLGPPMELHL